MPIPVQCPGCGAKLRAPDAAVGKSQHRQRASSRRVLAAWLAVVSTLAAVTSGCSKPAEPLDADQGVSTPTAPDTRTRHERLAAIAEANRKADDAVGLPTLWNAYLDDAAGAPKQYGDRPRVRVKADEMQKTSSGYAVIRTLENDDGGMTGRARLLFSEKAGEKLAGRTGAILIVRGKVQTVTPRLFVMSGCEVE